MVEKRCFVISVIGREDSPERAFANELFTYIIEPAAKAAGYTIVRRADHFPTPGIITADIVDAIKNWELVIADLSHPNPNVYYELAVRHFTERPVVMMRKSGVELPFDVAAMRVLDYGMSIGTGKEAEKQLVAWIKEAETQTRHLNPVSLAVLVGELSQKTPEQGDLVQALLQGQREIQTELSQMRVAIRRLRSAAEAPAPGMSGSPAHGWTLSGPGGFPGGLPELLSSLKSPADDEDSTK